MERLAQFDVFDMPVAVIYYDGSFNCRGEFTVQSCSALSESIEANGLNFPIVVQPIADIQDDILRARLEVGGYDWRLIAGHRRYTAATRYLKWRNIPASVRRGLTERQARMLNFTENLERKDLNMLEEARWIGSYFPAGTPITTIAAEIKRDHRWVGSRVRLMKLPDLVQQMAASQTLSAVDIDTIAAQETVELQLKAAHDIQSAKRRGEGREIGTKYGRKFRYRMTKSQISDMVKYMLERGIDGLGPRALTWAAGYIGDAELLDDIEEELRSK